jgi:hypothetical protein
MIMKVEGQTTEEGNTMKQRKYVTSVMLTLRSTEDFCQTVLSSYLTGRSLMPHVGECDMLYQLPWVLTDCQGAISADPINGVPLLCVPRDTATGSVFKPAP